MRRLSRSHASRPTIREEDWSTLRRQGGSGLTGPANVSNGRLSSKWITIIVRGGDPSQKEMNMVRLTISPRSNENLYGLLVQKELTLRRMNRGTLHRQGPKKKNEEKWGHASKNGWIRFQNCLGHVLTATIQARDEDEEWQLLNSFIGFLDRHFRASIASILISYEALQG
jgi:hypothetical protein